MATQTMTRGDNHHLRRFLNVFALGSVVTVNALANILPINGVTTGELSDGFASLFTPAGYVFSIWGLIYLLLIVFAVYQALDAQKNNARLESLGYAFIISCVFNIGWIFAWHYQQILLSSLFMFGILAALIVCYERLNIGRGDVPLGERLSVNLPFSIYLGWITVATVANVTVQLLEWEIDGGTAAPLWTIIAIVAALAIGLLVLLRRGDVPYTLVLVWAFAGIAVKQWGAVPSVAITAILAAAVIVGFQVVRLAQSKARLVA